VSDTLIDYERIVESSELYALSSDMLIGEFLAMFSQSEYDLAGCHPDALVSEKVDSAMDDIHIGLFRDYRNIFYFQNVFLRRDIPYIRVSYR
jgi:hypothetical protein